MLTNAIISIVSTTLPHTHEMFAIEKFHFGSFPNDADPGSVNKLDNYLLVSGRRLFVVQ